MLEGLLETVPLPVLVREMVRVPMALKVAETVASLAKGRTHVDPEPVQAPDQPAKTLLAEGVAVSVTDVFWANAAEQTDPQLRPPGELVTVPVPVPSRDTVSDLRVSDGLSHVLSPAK